MKKDERQLLIREIIQNEKLSTQKDIQDRLDQRGAGVTQTTLSRDLREIGLIKVKEKGGKIPTFFYLDQILIVFLINREFQ